MNPRRLMNDKLFEVRTSSVPPLMLLSTNISGMRASIFVYIPITVAKLNIIILL